MTCRIVREVRSRANATRNREALSTGEPTARAAPGVAVVGSVGSSAAPFEPVRGSLPCVSTDIGNPRDRVHMADHDQNYRTVMTFISGKWNRRWVLLRALSIAVPFLSLSASPATARRIRR